MSDRRTRQGSVPSGTTTRQPSLKSKRMPCGPVWVGISAAGGKARFWSAGVSSPELAAADTLDAAGNATTGPGGPISNCSRNVAALAPCDEVEFSLVTQLTPGITV